MAYKRNSAAAEEKLKEITDRLEKGIEELFTSERYMEYLKVMSKFHNYSMNNNILIALQRPDSTYVAGYNAWKQKFHRSVKAGEHGIQILVPIVKKYSYEKDKIDPVTKLPVVDENGDTVKEKHEGSAIAYRPSYVFDISQTTGEPLPTIASELKGDVAGYKRFFEAITAVSPVPVEFEPIPFAKGYFDRKNKRIAIKEGMSQQQNVKTAIHELAHATLHDFDKNAKPEEVKDKYTMEVEAESVAYTICQHYGIDTSEYSFGYVASWSSDHDLPELKASLKTIRDTASELIEKLDEKLEEIEKEHQKENIEAQENEQAAKVREQEQLEIEKKEKVTEMAVAAQAVIVPLYLHSAAYAREHGEGDAWKKSFRLNTECINDIASNAEKALNEGKINEYADKLIADYGLDRAMYVLARNIIENKEYNIEYSNDVRSRANEFEFPEMQNGYDGSEIYLRDMDSTVVQKLFRELMDRERENEKTPDKTTVQDMNDYGYTYEGMLPMQKETALELYDDDEAIFKLYPDDTESMVTDREEIEEFDGLFGIEKEDWIKRMRIEESIVEEEHGAKVMENDFLNGKEDGFAIYQLNSKADHKLMFAGVERIGGIDKVEKGNYKVMYADTVDTNADTFDVLESIFEQFNIARPEDFKGHSLSVGDIIALRKDGELKAFYVDSFSFEEIPQFFPENRNDLVWDNDRETFLEKVQEMQSSQKAQESKASPDKQRPQKGHNIQQSRNGQKQNAKSERVSVRQKLAENKEKVAKQKKGHEKTRQHKNERDRR